jgi:hypothetical protein
LQCEGIDVLGGVFISYRREDSAGFAGRIYDRLTQRLDLKSVFLDVDNIQPGLDFFDVLSEKLRLCDVVIAVIGKNWNSSTDEGNQRRLDDPDDFVRIEIEAALERRIRVIPVLIDGATMPRREDLPESLQQLRRRQAIEISHNRFDSDVERLTRALSLIEEELRQREAAEAELAAREGREQRKAAEVARAEEARQKAELAGREGREQREAAEAARAEEARQKAEVEARRVEEERRLQEAEAMLQAQDRARLREEDLANERKYLATFMGGLARFTRESVAQEWAAEEAKKAAEEAQKLQRFYAPTFMGGLAQAPIADRKKRSRPDEC